MRTFRYWRSSGCLAFALSLGCVLEHTNPVDPEYVPTLVSCTEAPTTVGTVRASGARALSDLATGRDGALASWVDFSTGDVLVRRWGLTGLGPSAEVAPGESPSLVAVAALGAGWVTCWSSRLQADNRRPLRCRTIGADGFPFGAVITVVEHHGQGGFAIASHAQSLWVAYVVSGDRAPMVLARLDNALRLVGSTELPDATGLVREFSLAAGDREGLLLVHDSSVQPLAVTLNSAGAWVASTRLAGGVDTATSVATVTADDGMAVGAFAAYTETPWSPGICTVVDGDVGCDDAAPLSPLLYGGQVALAAHGAEIVLGAVSSNQSRGMLTWFHPIDGRLYDVRHAALPLSWWFRLASSGDELILMNGAAAASPDAVELTLASLSCR